MSLAWPLDEANRGQWGIRAEARIPPPFCRGGVPRSRHEVALPHAGQMVDVPFVVLGDGRDAGLGLQDQLLVERLGAEFPTLRQFHERAEGCELVDRQAGTILVR